LFENWTHSKRDVQFCSNAEPNRTPIVWLSSIGFLFDFVRLDTPGLNYPSQLGLPPYGFRSSCSFNEQRKHWHCTVNEFKMKLTWKFKSVANLHSVRISAYYSRWNISFCIWIYLLQRQNFLTVVQESVTTLEFLLLLLLLLSGLIAWFWKCFQRYLVKISLTWKQTFLRFNYSLMMTKALTLP